jgi:hypothetical protein
VRQQQRGNAAPGVVVDTPEYVAGKILEAIQKEPTSNLWIPSWLCAESRIGAASTTSELWQRRLLMLKA